MRNRNRYFGYTVVDALVATGMVWFAIHVLEVTVMDPGDMFLLYFGLNQLNSFLWLWIKWRKEPW